MKMVKYAIAIAGLGVAVSSAQAQIVNGNFQSGLTGWNPSGNVYASANDSPGTESAIFAANMAANGQLSQTFTTIPGDFYSLNFNIGEFGAPTSQTLDVYLNGTLKWTPVSPVGSMPASITAETFGFDATGTSTTLEFADVLGNNNVNSDLLLQNVSVRVPDGSSTSILCGMSLIGLGWLRRKLV